MIRTLLTAVICSAAFCSTLGASILGYALTSFPTNTDYVEVDNLAALRALPYYRALRGRFSGESLQEAQTVLFQLGISEAQVEEIAIGSNANATYGLAAGTFSRRDPAIKARLKLYAVKLFDTDLYCVGRATCVTFLEDWMVAFGTPESLKSVLLARQGVLTALSGNTEAVRLFESEDKAAPVRGVLFGDDLQSALSKTFQQWFGKLAQSVKFPAAISGVGYSVTFGTTAHLRATLQCSSRNGAALLAQTLNALSLLQSVTASSAASRDSFGFERAKASADGSRVSLAADVRVSGARRE